MLAKNYICVKYTTAATKKNDELDALCTEIDSYKDQIKTIFSLVRDNFPNDKSFYIGVENVVNQINQEVSNFNSSISDMKTDSLNKAKIKDEAETIRYRNIHINRIDGERND